ncbi:MAG: FtsQ-type POTRA domain-containing protein [Mogibacterium sp.]|nr:FtsQ-type POTRA domain-containing protein [Mogibacterium sp.]
MADDKTQQVNKDTLVVDRSGDDNSKSPDLTVQGYENFTDWTLTPMDVDLEKLLAEDLALLAARQAEEEGVSDDTIAVTDDTIAFGGGRGVTDDTIAFGGGRGVTDDTIAFDGGQGVTDATIEVPAATIVAGEPTRVRDATLVVAPLRQISDETITANADQNAPKETINLQWDKSDTRVIKDTTNVPEINWKQAEDEESGYKGNEGRITSYGLSDSDTEDITTVEEEKPQDIKAIEKKIRKRKKANEARKKRNSFRIKMFLVIFVSLIFIFIFTISSVFTVDAIEVRGNNHFTAEEIINIGHAVPGRNLIYDLQGAEIVEYLEQNPYIKSAEVTRKLPSTMVITVRERTQAFVFRYDDDFLVMDDEGMLLKKSRTQPKITVVTGLVVNKIKLGEKIGTQDKKLLQKTLNVIKSMKESDLYFVSLDMGEDDAVTAYIYDTLIVRGTTEELITNLENGRLHKVVEQLFSKKIRRGTISFGEDGTISFEPGI